MQDHIRIHKHPHEALPPERYAGYLAGQGRSWVQMNRSHDFSNDGFAM
jgi:hypothetical protein